MLIPGNPQIPAPVAWYSPGTSRFISQKRSAPCHGKCGLASTTPPPLVASSLPTASPFEPNRLLCPIGAGSPVEMLPIEAGRTACPFTDAADGSAGGPYSGFASAYGPR